MCLEGRGQRQRPGQRGDPRLFAQRRAQDTLRGLIGKDVHLRGSFMGAMTQHQQGAIVMQVTEADEI